MNGRILNILSPELSDEGPFSEAVRVLMIAFLLLHMKHFMPSALLLRTLARTFQAGRAGPDQMRTTLLRDMCSLIGYSTRRFPSLCVRVSDAQEITKACNRNKAWLLLAFPILALSACEKAAQLNRFGEISVSAPDVIGETLQVSIKNDTDHTLCYFNDSLFYGSGVVEGNSDSVSLSESPISFPLRDLQFFNGREGGRIKELNGGEGEIFIALSDKKPSSGDDVMFSIFFCKENAQGEYRTFVYTGRL